MNKSNVPDVLPIRLGLESGKDMPLDAASPKFGKKVTTPESILAGGIAAPPIATATGEEE